MPAPSAISQNSDLILRRCIQKVATGPEASKDLSYDEAYAAMQSILNGSADPVQTGVFFIALRMKRETDEENRAIFQAILDASEKTTAAVETLIDVADPYDGYTRHMPVSPFLPAVLAACGLPAVVHGLESVGPKYGVTIRKVLRAAKVPVDLSTRSAVRCLEDQHIAWAYLDQKAICPKLYALVPLRTRIVKRPVLTTVEVLTNPIRAKGKTHLLTGYVHKAYPPVYASLARQAGFDTAMIVRGTEGGVIPSLKQAATVFEYYHGGAESPRELDPAACGIRQSVRAVPLPVDLPTVATQADHIAASVDMDALATIAAKVGLEALSGKPGPAYDSLVYATAVVLTHTHRYRGIAQAADKAREIIDSQLALAHFQAAMEQ